MCPSVKNTYFNLKKEKIHMLFSQEKKRRSFVVSKVEQTKVNGVVCCSPLLI